MDLRGELVRVPALGIDFEVLSGDAIIGPSIARGSWADHETALFRAHVVPGCTVVDLGANVGWFTVQGILAGADVHAFEPVPAIADVCQRNIARAMAVGRGRATLHRCAAGAERTSASIALANTNFGDNRVLQGDSERPADMGPGESLGIEVVPLDELVRGPVRVLKIDTQGSEWLALQGARRLLRESPSLAILIEFWPYALRGAEPAELLRFLEEQGFTIGKATEAPYPMSRERILRQALARDPVRGGIDLYATRGLPFHTLGAQSRLRSLWRAWQED